MMKRRTLLLALAAALALPLAASATAVVAMSVEQMTGAVPVIVRGRIGQLQSSWDSGRGRIWTYAEVTVTESLKGGRDGTILVKQPGGEVAGIGQRVAGAARFAQGEDCVLFLEPSADEKDTWVVFALAAGKVDLEQRLGQLQAVRRLEGLVLVEPGQRTIRPVGDLEVLGQAEAFLSRVRAAVKGGAR